MTSDLDIYRSAKLLVDQHGEDAATEAALQADRLLAAGEMDGQRAWVRHRPELEPSPVILTHSDRAILGQGQESTTERSLIPFLIDQHP